ncbi:MAG: phytoene desaturase family protein [Propionibacteriaceae bacterium]
MSRAGGRGEPERVAIIGGGISGLATAALLANRGHSVDLLEQHDSLGGRAGSWQADGFRFDTGPSWYLMPEVFDHFFRLLGTTAAAELDLVRLDPGYRVIFESGAEPVDVRPDRAHNVDLFEQIEPGAGARLEGYLDSARHTHDVALRRFLYTTFQSPLTLFHPEVIRGAARLARGLFEPLDRFIGRHFADQRLRQLLGYPAVFLGTSPDRAPSLFHLMSSLDLVDGVLYPQGGMVRVIEAITRLAEQAGARLHTGSRVTQIRTARPGRARARVRGVRYTDRAGSDVELAAEVVVGAGDLHDLETRLLPRELQSHPQRRWDRRESGPGAVLACLGVRGAVPELAHHSLLFTRDWERNFADLRGPGARIPDPASLYVCRPSATDPSVAPDGAENLFVLVPVPADPEIGRGGREGSGDVAVEATVDRAIDQISSWAKIPDLAERVVLRRTTGPADFVDAFQSWQGGALGPAHTWRQSAFLRGRNASSKLGGLLYAGAATIPGIGLPMCLISAELVLKRLIGDRSSTPVREP